MLFIGRYSKAEEGHGHRTRISLPNPIRQPARRT